MSRPEPLEIAGQSIAPGTRQRVEIPVSHRFTGTPTMLPVEVVHGREAGPRLFVSAAMHGDEINGVEIIRRVLRRPLKKMRGTLIAVPIVNVFGFVGLARNLPDRRDLNRSFPGTPSGSLASRLAHIFMNEVVKNATHGIDLHTAALHRSNLPQVRACLDHPETSRLAMAFGVPVVMNANLRDGSLRQEVLERKIPMLVYEAGEALRFDENAIRAGVQGVLGVMVALEMLKRPARTGPKTKPFIARSSHWVRAPQAGILRARVRLGAAVAKGDRVGIIADPLGTDEVTIRAPYAGIAIGRTELPLVHEGDAVVHIATFERPASVASSVQDFEGHLEELG